jgi:hypothetical protein
MSMYKLVELITTLIWLTKMQDQCEALDMSLFGDIFDVFECHQAINGELR